MSSGNHRVVCLAREGWIFFKVLQHLKKCGLIELSYSPIYLKVSRTVLFRSLLGYEATWDVSLESKFEGSVLQLMMKRFGLQLHEVYSLLPEQLLEFKLALPQDKDKVKQWLMPHNLRLAAYVEPTKSALLRYFSDEGLFEGPDSLMLDLGYAGTIQKLITQILGRDTAGLYFIANSSGELAVGKHIAAMRGVFKEDVRWAEGYLMLERSLLLESLMTSPHGSVVDIRLRTDGQLDFFYGQSAATQRYYQDLEAIIQGAISGVEEGFRFNIEYCVSEIDSLYEAFATSPSAIPREAYHLFNIDDNFSGNGVVSATQLFGL